MKTNLKIRKFKAYPIRFIFIFITCSLIKLRMNSEIEREGEEEELIEEDTFEQLRRVSHLWSINTTAHILPKIFRNKYFHLKLLWIIFFALTGTISLALTFKYLKDYFKYRVNVNVQIIYESPTYFPAITFCNLNPFYYPRAHPYINNILKENNFTYPIKNLTTSKTAMNLTKVLNELVKASLAANTNLTFDERKNLSFNLNEMLISCSFNGISCDVRNFSLIQNYDNGNCYTFNSGKDANGTSVVIQQTSLSGPNGGGLELELFVGDPDIHDIFNYKNGIHLIIHNQTFQPLISDEGISVATGIETNVAIKRTFITKLGYPYNECSTDLKSLAIVDTNSPLYQTLMQIFSFMPYTQKQCFNLCYQIKIVHDCNCTDPRYVYPIINTTTTASPILQVCHNATQIQCLTKTKAQFQNNPISELCSNFCPLECMSILYSSTYMVSNYPTLNYAKLLKLEKRFFNKTSSYERIKYSSLKLNVYYEDMSYETITESPALTWDVLLGNIGGMLSLFVGVSMITIGEIFELMLEIMRIIFF